MGAIVSQITMLTMVYSTVYSDADQRKHQSSASLAFVQGIHREPVNSPHKRPENVSIWWRHHDSPSQLYSRLSDAFIYIAIISVSTDSGNGLSPFSCLIFNSINADI